MAKLTQIDIIIIIRGIQKKMEQDLFISVLPALSPESIEDISKGSIEAEIIFTQQTDCEDEDQFIPSQNPYIFQIRKNFLVECQPKSRAICGGIQLTLQYKFQIKRFTYDLDNQFGIAYAFILHFPPPELDNEDSQNQEETIIKLGVKNQDSKNLQKFAECLQNKIIYQLDINSNYRITERLYLSYTATIYVGKGYKDTKEYAIKCIKKELFNKTGRNLQKAVSRQYQIPKIVPHKNICRYYGIFSGEEAVYVIMERLQLNLVQFLQVKKYVKVSEVKSYFYQICLAVSILHDNCIMHRDIKPQNIMMRKNQSGYEPVLIDFGMAEFEDKQPYAIDRCGTPGYVAPEMINKPLPYDRGCDIFSLGCLFHFLILGKPLFDGSSAHQIKMNNIKCEIDSQKQLYKNMNPDAKDLLFRMLQKQAYKRIKIRQILNHKYLNDEQAGACQNEKNIQSFPNTFKEETGSNLQNRQNFQQENKNSSDCGDCGDI